jgi:hypothetical protein
MTNFVFSSFPIDGITIDSLPNETSPLLTDLIPAVQGGVTYSLTLQQLQTLFNSTILPIPFTPAFVPTNGAFSTITYSSQMGNCIQIGKLCFININLSLSALVNGTASGPIIITGLPFVIGLGAGNYFPLDAVYSNFAFSSSYTQLNAYGPNGYNELNLVVSNPNNTAFVYGNANNLTASSILVISGCLVST